MNEQIVLQKYSSIKHYCIPGSLLLLLLVQSHKTPTQQQSSSKTESLYSWCLVTNALRPRDAMAHGKPSACDRISVVTLLPGAQ